MASSLLPPNYPNSKVIDIKQDWTANAKTETRIYQTADRLQDVLSFMEKHMPGFKQGENGHYYNHAVSTGLLAQFAASISGTGGLPSAGIELYPSGDTGTTIKVTVTYPSP
jgi:hypothetical protein